ncbi:hypothetical protein [Levilactobacillus namurensis]|uniref:hypothetical protein n=1 Tax=Levilactobacillus namurensis TaxID=380393 RepID=UPI0004645243|nr:hypothetical protein [Levilactobacillus namurensis]
MEPSKIEITNLRDDEENIKVEAINMSRNDLMFGLVCSGMIIAKKTGLSREEYLNAVQRLAEEYESNLSVGYKEVLADD